MSLARLAITLSAHALARLAESDYAPPETGDVSATSRGDVGGWQVTVILTRFEPARLATVEEFRADMARLRDIEQAIMGQAPGQAEEPATVKQIARKCGYACSGHFREAVRGLLEKGLLVRGARGGIKRAE